MSDFYRNLEDKAERIYLDTKEILSSCQVKTAAEHKKAHLTELATEAFKAIEEIRTCFKEDPADVSRKHDFIISRSEHLQRLKEHAHTIEAKLAGEEKARLLDVENAAFSHYQEFSEAQDQHEAWFVFCILLISAGLFAIGCMIYWNLKDFPMESNVSIPTGRLIFVGLGKLSLVAFCIWGIRYLMTIHFAHAAQAITYRDRRMAMAVAQATFKLNETAEGKRNVLSRVVDSCFDLSKNSFYNLKDPHLLPNSKQIGALSEALKPVLELAKTATAAESRGDKGKEKEKAKEKEKD